jgi:putative copper export protein
MYDYFAAIASWPVSRAINESSWIFALIQALHLVALAFLAGALLVVDLRLLGKGFSQQPVARVARDARPWLYASIVAMVLTGVPQFISLATKEFESPYFRDKMMFLAVALIFTFTVRQRVAFAPEGKFGPGVAKVVALISIALWTSVAIEGRLIGFFS